MAVIKPGHSRTHTRTHSRTHMRCPSLPPCMHACPCAAQKLLEEAMGGMGGMPEPGTPLLTLPSGANDLIQIFLE